MGKLCILGAPNVVATVPGGLYTLGYGEISAGSAASGLPVSNLQTEGPSDLWRTATRPWPLDCWVGWGATSAAWPEPYIDAVGVVNHNLSRAGLARITRGASAPEEIVPDAIAASTNLTGAVTAIDEGKVPGGDWLTPTVSGTAWSLRVTFPTPAAPPVGTQFFTAYLKRHLASPDSNKVVQVTASLYEGGVLVRALGTKYVRDSTGQWLVWSWSASELGTANGSAVEMKLDSAGVTDADLDSIVWACEETAPTQYDSGWFQAAPDIGATAWGGLKVLDAPPAQSFVALDDAATSTGQIRAWLVDDWAPTDADGTKEIIPNPTNYVQAGVLVAGVAFRPSINVDWGPMLGARDLSDKATTDGGQSYGVRRPVVRTLAVPLSWLTQDEAHALFDRLVLRRGMLAPVLISWDPEDSTEKVLTTFWATLTSAPTMEAISTFFSTGKSARRLAFQFEEYL